MDKHKAKNIVLGVSLALNVLGSLLIGGALIKSCNAPENAVTASLGSSSVEKVELHSPSPKMRPNIEEGVNVFDDGEYFRAVVMDDVYPTGGGHQLRIRTVNNWYGTWCASIPAGVYAIELTNPDYGAQYLITNDTMDGYIYNAMHVYADDFEISGTQSSNTWNYADTIYKSEWLNSTSGLKYVRVPYATHIYCSDNRSVAGAPAVRVIACNTLTIPAKDIVTFPADYNPIVMYGVPFDGYLFGKLSGETITGTNTGGVRKYLNGVFKIDNDIYDRIEIQFSSMSDRPYISTSGSVQTYPHESPLETIFPLGIYARLFGTDTLNTIWQCEYTFENGQQALSRSGRWLNQARQSIAVIDYDPAATGVSNMFPTYDTLQLLQVRTSSSQSVSVLGGDGNLDVFTLIAGAFTGLVPLFEVQLLPYLTIGTLLFVPLVVLLIFAILKVLNK